MPAGTVTACLEPSGAEAHKMAHPCGVTTYDRVDSGPIGREISHDRFELRRRLSRLRVVRALYALADREAQKVLFEGWRKLTSWRGGRDLIVMENPGAALEAASPAMPAVPLLFPAQARQVLERMRWGLIGRHAPACIDLQHWVRWLRLRDRVQAAWDRFGNAAGSIDRCGQDITLMTCPACHKEHPIEKTCRSRYCADCVGDVRHRTEKRVLKLVKEHFRHLPRFVTFTKRNRRDLLGGSREMIAAFGRLRRLRHLFRDGFGRWWGWADVVRGGIYAVEITEDLGRRDDLVWHPHIHALLDSQLYLPWSWLVEGWQRANGCKCPRSKNRKLPVLCRHSTWIETKGRFQGWTEHAADLARERTLFRRGRSPERELPKILRANKCKGCDVEPSGLNIQAAGKSDAAVHELVKYVGKSLKTSQGMMAFAPALEEFLEETFGKRMLSAFGALHGAEKKEAPEPLVCDDCGTELEFVTIMSVVGYERQQRAPPGTA